MKKIKRFLKYALITSFFSISALPLLAVPVSCSSIPADAIEMQKEHEEFVRLCSLRGIYDDFDEYIPNGKLFSTENNTTLNYFHWTNKYEGVDTTAGIVYCLAYQKTTDEVVACALYIDHEYDNKISIEELKIPEYIYTRNVYSNGKDGNSNKGKFKVKLFGYPYDSRNDIVSGQFPKRGKFKTIERENVEVDLSKYPVELIDISILHNTFISKGLNVNFKFIMPNSLVTLKNFAHPLRSWESEGQGSVNTIELDFSKCDNMRYLESNSSIATKIFLPKNIEKIGKDVIRDNHSNFYEGKKVEIVGFENVKMFAPNAFNYFYGLSPKTIKLNNNVWYCDYGERSFLSDVEVVGGKTYSYRTYEQYYGTFD